MGWNFCHYLVMAWLLFWDRAIAYPVPVDFDGTLLRWQESDQAAVTYEVIGSDANVSTYGALVDEAATMWSEVKGSSLRLQRAKEGQVAQISMKLKSHIEGGDYSAGFAVFDQQNEHGPQHCSAEMLVSEAYYDFSLAKTLLHEMGHCIGLGHSVYPSAIMSYSLNENEFALDTDDSAAVARLYPEDNEIDLPKGCAITSSQRVHKALLWLLLLVPVLGPMFSLSGDKKLLSRQVAKGR